MEKPRKGKKTGLPPIFDEDFKIMVAREYLTGKLSYSQLARKYGLSGEHTPRYFVKWYQQWLQDRELQVQPDIVPSQEEVSRIKELEKQLFQANLKVTALELLIRTTEENLGIDMGKKAGTKPSAK